VAIRAGKIAQQNLTLDIAVAEQRMTVNERSSGLETSPDTNAGVIVIKGKDLDALSDDPDQLQDELNALAGPAAGPNGGQIYMTALLAASFHLRRTAGGADRYRSFRDIEYTHYREAGCSASGSGFSLLLLLRIGFAKRHVAGSHSHRRDSLRLRNLFWRSEG
jgi:hypothetical protein